MTILENKKRWLSATIAGDGNRLVKVATLRENLRPSDKETVDQDVALEEEDIEYLIGQTDIRSPHGGGVEYRVAVLLEQRGYKIVSHTPTEKRDESPGRVH